MPGSVKQKGENKRMARTNKRAVDRTFERSANSPAALRILVTKATEGVARGSQRPSSPIRTGHCSGCNVRIPSSQLQRALVGKTIQCEHCRLFLYPESWGQLE